MPDAPADIPPTGERIVPGHVPPDLYYEHVTRYQFAAALCHGRTVLDAGCGAGYGARLLARRASYVVAMDRSEQVLRYAACRYPGPRLRYVAGDCGRLPFADGTFERVVCFEVIEHLAGDAGFLREVRRVLSPQGLLVVSTPNRRQYIDARPGYSNPFHVREYYFAEWARLLDSVFPAVRHFDQQYAQGLSFVERGRDGRPARPGLPHPEMAHEDGNRNGPARFDDGGHEAAQFFVAICAADASLLPDLPPRQFLLTAGDVLAERTKWVRLLQDEVEAGRARIAEANRMLQNVHRELDERTHWARTAAEEVAERDDRIRRLEAELARMSARPPAEAGPTQFQALSAKVDALAARHEEMMDALEDLHQGFTHLKGAEGVADDLRYRQLVRRLRKVVDANLRPDATVLVVSKGDEPLLELGARRAWHFPQDREGNYAGFNPADSGSAVVHLEALRARGAQYLVLPAPCLWWLKHYAGLARHLARHYRLLLRQDDVCAIYSLTEPPAARAEVAVAGMAGVVAEFERRYERRPAVLDWSTGLRLAAAFPELMVFSPPGGGEPGRLPYLERTVDLVAVAATSQAVVAEAQRVAAGAVVSFPLGTEGAAAAPRVHWLREATAPPPPSVSIVIPSYNGAALTDACLRALSETLPADFRGEVIVVDDCSTDDTQSRLSDWPGRVARMNVRLLRNAHNSGFLVTCNNGAAAATGDYVILMNNDTLPQRAWLEPLLRTFRDHPDAGAVGCKLVYPDGRLQEAGGIVFDDGSAANFGKFDYQLDLPLYNHVREVDYVTGALIMTPRALFNELGGLDTSYRPIYYEETDYCFRLRERGYKVYYQPLSVVIHLEGVTCGTDTGSGQKRYQVVNRQKFVERWRQALRRQPPCPGKFDRVAWHRLAVRDDCVEHADAAGASGSNGSDCP